MQKEATERPTAVKQRIIGIDTFRVLAALGVIAIHIWYLCKCTQYEIVYGTLRNMSRFAVPYFMLCAGYFFARRAEEMGIKTALKKTVLRLIKVFFGWTLFYQILPLDFVVQATNLGWEQGLLRPAVNNLRSFPSAIFHNTADLLWNGTCYHLWFFPALIAGLILASLLACYLEREHLLLAAAICFALAVWCSLHSFWFSPPSSYRWGNGPFYSGSLILFAWWVYSRKYRFRFPLILFLIGLAIRTAECYLLSDILSPGSDRFNMMVCSPGGTTMGVAVFFWALKQREFGRGAGVYKSAPLVLGIYAVHPVVITSLPAGYFFAHLHGAVIAHSAYLCAVFLISAALCHGLKQVRFFRWLVA